MNLRSAYKENLMGKPSLVSDYCVVCGKYCTEGHHTVQKGIGGVKRHIDKQIPRVSLCHDCHMEYHSKRLHLQFDNGWLWYWSQTPMSDEDAWRTYRNHYSPAKTQQEYITYGRGK